MRRTGEPVCVCGEAVCFLLCKSLNARLISIRLHTVMAYGTHSKATALTAEKCIQTLRLCLWLCCIL